MTASNHNLSQVSSKYGAPMGRGGETIEEFIRRATAGENKDKAHLQRVTINQGGYDVGGAYWGAGQALWHAWVWDVNGEEVEVFLRAPSRAAVKAKLSPVRFFR